MLLVDEGQCAAAVAGHYGEGAAPQSEVAAVRSKMVSVLDRVFKGEL